MWMYMVDRKRLAFLPISKIAVLIERIGELNCQLNAYIYVNPDEVRKQARQADHEIVRGRYSGSLHGIPIAVKDNILTARIPTTAGSKILKVFVPTKNAFVVERLR